jgi:NhaA family Na+:H+ antiporter
LLPWNACSCWDLFNVQLWTIAQAGAGIPMATDIALHWNSLLRNRVPLSLKIFLTALAVIDDLERLWLLPYFTRKLFYGLIFLRFGTMLILFVLNRMKVKSSLPFGGVIMWWFMFTQNSRHCNRIISFVIPFGMATKTLPHLFCIFCINRLVFILPLFALAGDSISSNIGNYCSTLQYWNRFRINRRKTIGYFLFWLFL